MPSVAILDVDGTLFDRDYQRALAWHRALAEEGCKFSIWSVHRHVGMGASLIVDALCGAEVEGELGESIRARARKLYRELAYEAAPINGSRELVAELGRRGRDIVLAGAGSREIGHYARILGASADTALRAAVEEPFPAAADVLAAALAMVGDAPATLVGDSTWDARAAGRCGIPCVGVATGAHSDRELRAAGADPVFESLTGLVLELDSTPIIAAQSDIPAPDSEAPARPDQD